MANICSTTYYITTTPDIIDKIWGVLSSVNETPGGILIKDFLQGIGFKDNGYYRGSICFADKLEDNQLTMDVDSAWSRVDEIEEALSALGEDDMSVLWASEELGCEIFETNDSEGEFFDLEYYYVSSDDDSDYITGEKNLVDWINNFYGEVVCHNEKEALDYVASHDGEDYGYICVYKRELV